MKEVYIPQKLLEKIKKSIEPNKVIVVYGPRRCGKTTLLKKFLEQTNEDYLSVQGDDIFIKEDLGSRSIEKLKKFIGKHKLLIIDEAQKIPNIGLNLKLIVDSIEGIKILVSGSASFDLYQQVGEPLTGRKMTFCLYPLSQIEFSKIEKFHETKANLESRLIFGSYPEAVLAEDNQKRIYYLKELISSYLYKDILELDGLKHSDKIVKILQLLSFQIGNEVSYSEIGSQIGLNKKTVERYLDLLEKVFVIFKLRGLSRNPRKEISKSPKYYFYDLGVRNALIGNFNPINIRNDVGLLWENYLIYERLKKQEYSSIYANNYFWRTYTQKEVDFVEEREGKLFGYEFKWGKDKSVKEPKEWRQTYSNAEYKIINPENYLEFIL